MAATNDTHGGFLIAIEGLDASGKTTLAHSLQDKLLELGYTVEYFNFRPSSHSLYCSPLRRNLTRDELNNPYVTFLLFAADRFYCKKYLEKALQQNKIIICDRYKATDIAFGMAHGVEQHWAEMIYGELPPADMTFYMDMGNIFDDQHYVNPDTANIKNYERAEYLRKVCTAFQTLATLYSYNWCTLSHDLPSDENFTQALSHFFNRHEKLRSDPLDDN